MLMLLRDRLSAAPQSSTDSNNGNDNSNEFNQGMIKLFCVASVPVYSLGTVSYLVGFYNFSDLKLFMLLGAFSCVISLIAYLVVYFLVQKPHFYSLGFWLFMLVFFLSMWYGEWMVGPLRLAIGFLFGIGLILATSGLHKIVLLVVSVLVITPGLIMVLLGVLGAYSPVIDPHPLLENLFDILIVGPGTITVIFALFLPLRSYVTTIENQNLELTNARKYTAKARQQEREKLAAEIHSLLQPIQSLTTLVGGYNAPNSSPLSSSIVKDRLAYLMLNLRKISVSLIRIETHGSLFLALDDEIAQLTNVYTNSSVKLISTSWHKCGVEKEDAKKIIERLLSLDVKNLIYLIITEAITNALKHSKATTIKVSVTINPIALDSRTRRKLNDAALYTLDFSVVDNGIGMSENELNQKYLSPRNAAPNNNTGASYNQGLPGMMRQIQYFPFPDSKVERTILKKLGLKVADLQFYSEKGSCFKVVGSVLVFAHKSVADPN